MMVLANQSSTVVVGRRRRISRSDINGYAMMYLPLRAPSAMPEDPRRDVGLHVLDDRHASHLAVDLPLTGKSNPPAKSAASGLESQYVISWVVCHECRLSTAVRNCTRDGGGPSGIGNQVLISSHRELPLSKAAVVSVAETPGHDSGRHG